MKKIATWNVNGLRSVYKKNFLNWFKNENADIVCLQEIKCMPEQVPDELQKIDGYYSYFNSAERKGYSGTAVYTKQKPEKIDITLGHERFDKEGRLLRLDFKDFSLYNLYIPNGSRDKRDLDYKLEIYDLLISHLKRREQKSIVLTGDFNIAHKEIDLARPKQNKNNIMFTPEEREKFSELLDAGFLDSFRMFNKDGGFYTWWAYFRNLRERNIGWRIDYVLVSKPLKKFVKEVFIRKEASGSDHCPAGAVLSI